MTFSDTTVIQQYIHKSFKLSDCPNILMARWKIRIQLNNAFSQDYETIGRAKSQLKRYINKGR